MKLPDPIAYFDPQEKGFYWAIPIGVFAPTTVTVPPLALYLESALMEVRRAALQEAATICDALDDKYELACAANVCAERIRALMEEDVIDAELRALIEKGGGNGS